MMGALREMFVVNLALLTDPLRIQPWVKDRRNQTKSSRDRRKPGTIPEKTSRDSRQKKWTRVASKDYHRQEGTQKRQKTE